MDRRSKHHRSASHMLPPQARLLLGRNELRRLSDRIEGAVLLALSAAFLTTAVLAAALASHIYQSNHAAGAHLRAATAELTRPGPAAAIMLEPVIYVRARWRLPNGAERSGFVSSLTTPAVYGAPAGASVQVWLDRSGKPHPPPPGRLTITINAIGTALSAGIIVTAGGAVLFVLCYWLCRVALDHRRLARWESGWAVTGPRWTSRQ